MRLLRRFSRPLSHGQPQARFDTVEEFREAALVLRVPGTDAGPQINRTRRGTRLSVHRKMLFEAVTHHLGAWRRGIQAENRKLRFFQPSHLITSPTTSS